MIERIDSSIITYAKPIMHKNKVWIDDYLDILLCKIRLTIYLNNKYT